VLTYVFDERRVRPAEKDLLVLVCIRSGILSFLAGVSLTIAIGQSAGVEQHEKDDFAPATVCEISGPKGPWDYYQTKDLPRGVCSAPAPCTVWTRDSCPGAGPVYPGPAIRWTCVCETGMWCCDEQERTKTACVSKGG